MPEYIRKRPKHQKRSNFIPAAAVVARSRPPPSGEAATPPKEDATKNERVKKVETNEVMEICNLFNGGAE